MRSYHKWVLSLGLAAVTPGIALADAFDPIEGTREPQTAQRAASADQQLADQVAIQLRGLNLTGHELDIKVINGVCVLEGSVAEASQIKKCEAAASKVRGIKQVDNRLTARSRGPIQRMSGILPRGGVTNAAFSNEAKSGANDQEMAQRVGKAISKSGVAGHDITVKYHDGAAILEGKVGSSAQVAQVTQAVSKVPGVKQVENRLSAPGMRPAKPQNQVVAERIAGALAQAGMSANDIEVRFNNGVATLRGTVAHPQQAAIAEQVVAQVPGVQDVSNELTAGQGPAHGPIQPVNYVQNPGMPMPGAGMPGAGMPGAPMMAPPMMAGPMQGPGRGPSHMAYDMPHLPPYAWPTYANYPNSASLSYPTQYSASAWPYIGPFYPYPQVPLGWRKVQLEWDDGYWNLNFNSRTDKWFWFLQPENW